MARGVNKVTLIGNLGNDPEVRYSGNGSAMANVSLATTMSWRDKDTGEQQERTEWHRIVFFGRLAEVVGEYLTKGRQIYIEGRLQTRKWEDKEGNERYTTEIVANEMQMLGNRNDAPVNQEPASLKEPTHKNSTDSSSKSSQPLAESPVDEFDEDIPF